MTRWLPRVALLVIALSPAALAQSFGPKWEEAADLAQKAAKSGDLAAVKKIAEAADPDPWMVLETLLTRGDRTTAWVLARASDHKAVARLPEYLATRLKDPDDRTKDVSAVVVLFGRGYHLQSDNRRAEAAGLLGAAEEKAQAIGWYRMAGLAGNQLATVLSELRRDEAAERAFRRAARRFADTDLSTDEARVLSDLATFLALRGRASEAYPLWERTEKVFRDHGEEEDLLILRESRAMARGEDGDILAAIEELRLVLAHVRKRGLEFGEAVTLHNLGDFQRQIGHLVEARMNLERALAIWKRLELPRRYSMTCGSLGVVYREMGAYARALDLFEASIIAGEHGEHRVSTARALSDIGVTHREFGNQALAREYFERARAILSRLKAWDELVEVDLDLASGLYLEGRNEEAIEILERIAARLRKGGNVPRLLAALNNLALALGEAGRTEAAMLTYSEIITRSRKVGDEASELRAIVNALGLAAGRKAAVDESLHRRAVDLSEKLGNRPARVHLRVLDAHREMAEGRHRAAAGILGDAVRAVQEMSGGLSHEVAPGAKESWHRLYELGMECGVRENDPGLFLWFLESARAGALLESLGGRRLRPALLKSPVLERNLQVARNRVRIAHTRLRDAARTRDGNAMAKWREELDVARVAVRTAIARIQREEKAVADLAYPKPASLETVRKHLAAGDVLVLYAELPEKLWALVITGKDARLVPLGTPAEFKVAAFALYDALEPGKDWNGAAAKMRALAVAPLKLGKDARRALVSPVLPLSFLPLHLLFPDREIVHLPSATTLVFLRAGTASRGGKVLALGDPDYGGRLPALKATREESRSVGDVVLLGKDATETGLRKALAKEPRWRAVHLSCHARIDLRASRCSLELTRAAPDDGALTLQEILGLRVPADLAVLSACETSIESQYRTEGGFGLVRAFMQAGAPRVIASLWRVPDEATRALMVHFYERWNPRDGSAGLPAAIALRLAQNHVRSRPGWEHPYYWAAWVLWGLPD